MSNLESQRPITETKNETASLAPQSGDVWSFVVNSQQNQWASQTDKSAHYSDQSTQSKNLVYSHILPEVEIISNSDPLARSAEFNTIVDGVAQGNYGDCFFEAALQSVAESTDGQQKIQDMIKMNKDGSYMVTFPGDKNQPVDVTIDDLAKYKTSNAGGWANIIETAFLKIDKAKTDGGNEAIDFDKAPFTSPTQALQLLTGEAAFADKTRGLWGLPKGELADVIQQALKDGEPITATSDLVPKGDQSSGSEGIYYPAPGSQWPIVGDHQFSVVAYDPKSETVYMRNPWATDNQGGALSQARQKEDGITNIDDGRLQMSLSTFEQHFYALDFGTKPLGDDIIGFWNGYVAD